MFLAQRMNTIIKLVRTYRVTTGFADRLRLAEDIFRLIEPDLRFFIFGSVSPQAADDVLQETLKAVATGMGKFAGGTAKEFWGWCYTIARNKRNDHFRKQANAREQPMAQDELWQLIESSAQVSPLSPADRHDLEYAMKLLIDSKPECYEYLWNHFVFGFDYAEIAQEQDVSYDNARMRISRCLDTAQSLVA